jgi:hypothetical protein
MPAELAADLLIGPTLLRRAMAAQANGSGRWKAFLLSREVSHRIV